MLKKLAIIGLTSMVLGGCTLTDSLKSGSAVSTKSLETQESKPVVDDKELEIIPSTSKSTDSSSLETDIENTKILEEDFSNLD
jgi:hypothetical protein